MKHKGLLIGLILVVIATIAGGAYFGTSHHKTQKKYQQTMVPTFFFHGYGSSYHAEQQMVNAAKDAGVTENVIRADVARNGDVTFVGQLNNNAKNPIVMVNYIDNKNPDFHTDGKWAKNVVTKLQDQYRFSKFNMVGHSMGNMAIMFYMLDNADNDKLPKLQKQVDIAGHFAGIIGMDDKPNQLKLDKDGKPERINTSYKELLPIRDTYPKNQVDVMNIFGDKDDGTHSDGAVSNASSKSLKHLIGDRAKSYTEHKIVGANAQHSKLHENKEVDQLLIKFLWNQESNK